MNKSYRFIFFLLIVFILFGSVVSAGFFDFLTGNTVGKSSDKSPINPGKAVASERQSSEKKTVLNDEMVGKSGQLQEGKKKGFWTKFKGLFTKEEEKSSEKSTVERNMLKQCEVSRMEAEEDLELETVCYECLEEDVVVMDFADDEDWDCGDEGQDWQEVDCS